MSAKLASLAAVVTAALLAGCGLPGQPTASAYSRNVGPGSSVSGAPQSDLGTGGSGNTYVPGAPAAGGIGSSGGGF